MKRINWTKVKDFIVENILFFIIVVITMAFVTSPLLLKNECFFEWISSTLSSLKLEGYKSSYIETLGALLGTFLAVSGALWTQRRYEKKKEKQIIKETATIIYFDFKFAFDEVSKFEYSYACTSPGTENGYDEVEFFNKYKRKVKILIDAGWITNVAKLCNVLLSDEIKQIYEIYGDFTTIQTAFEKPDKDIDNSTALHVYTLISSKLCDLIIAPRLNVSIKESNERLLEKLKFLAEIK